VDQNTVKATMTEVSTAAQKQFRLAAPRTRE
jgi:hypothetical protein